MTDLKPCPFCGSEAQKKESIFGWHGVLCKNCGGGSLEYHDNAELTTKAWDRRVLDKAIATVIEEAHMLLCYNYQSLMGPPSKTDGRYERSMRVWNLDLRVREMMPAADRALYDALMALR